MGSIRAGSLLVLTVAACSSSSAPSNMAPGTATIDSTFTFMPTHSWASAATGGADVGAARIIVVNVAGGTDSCAAQSVGSDVANVLQLVVDFGPTGCPRRERTRSAMAGWRATDSRTPRARRPMRAARRRARSRLTASTARSMALPTCSSGWAGHRDFRRDVLRVDGRHGRRQRHVGLRAVPCMPCGTGSQRGAAEHRVHRVPVNESAWPRDGPRSKQSYGLPALP